MSSATWTWTGAGLTSPLPITMGHGGAFADSEGRGGRHGGEAAAGPRMCDLDVKKGVQGAMSMIDYDARPVTPQVVLVGHRASSVGYSIRDFLSRNGVPYEWIDLEDAARVEALLPEDKRARTSCRSASSPMGCGLPRPRWKAWRPDWVWCRLPRARSTT